MVTILIIVATLVTAGALLHPRLARARLWQAAMTPLASIIGSGFLVLGPVLNRSFGIWSVAVMLGLCLGAYLFGAAIRFNIRRLAVPDRLRGRTENRIEILASWSLAFAYLTTVAFYLNLLGAFSVSLIAGADPESAKLVTSVILVMILVVGWTRGFGALERLEQVSVGLKLAIIGGLLAGLAWQFGDRAVHGGLIINPATISGWPALTLVAGLLVTVQGFETSRYLGHTYDPETRVRSMVLAQVIAAVIYLVYVALVSLLFRPDATGPSETAIIGLMASVAPVLPLMLVIAAISAQFSAALADTGGAGGLVEELTGGRLAARHGYALVAGFGLTLTWAASIFEIISYASRAFAVYYALQSTIAALGAWAEKRALSALGFAALAALGLFIAIFGQAVE